jgi:hypothetical protein
MEAFSQGLAVLEFVRLQRWKWNGPHDQLYRPFPNGETVQAHRSHSKMLSLVILALGRRVHSSGFKAYFGNIYNLEQM